MQPIAIMLMANDAGGGGGGALDTQYMTTGSSGTGNPVFDRQRGYISGSLGSLSDATSNLYSGAAIQKLVFQEQGEANDPILSLEIAGTQANSGWTTMTSSHGESVNRADATFSTVGGVSTWTWAVPASTAGSNFCTGSPTVTFT